MTDMDSTPALRGETGEVPLTEDAVISLMWSQGYSAAVIARSLQREVPAIKIAVAALPPRKAIAALHWKAYESRYGDHVMFAPSKDDVHRVFGGGIRCSFEGYAKDFRVRAPYKEQFVLSTQLSALGWLATKGACKCSVCEAPLKLVDASSSTGLGLCAPGEVVSCIDKNGVTTAARVGVEAIVCEHCWPDYASTLDARKEERLERLSGAAAKAGQPPEDALQSFMKRNKFNRRFVWVPLHEGTVKAAANPWSRVYHRIDGIKGQSVHLAVTDSGGWHVKRLGRSTMKLAELNEMVERGLVVEDDRVPVYQSELDRFCAARRIDPNGFKLRFPDGDFPVVAVEDGQVIFRKSKDKYYQITIEQADKMLGRGLAVLLDAVKVTNDRGLVERYPVAADLDMRKLGRQLHAAGLDPEETAVGALRVATVWNALARAGSRIGYGDWGKAVRANVAALTDDRSAPEVVAAAALLLHCMTTSRSHILGKSALRALASDRAEPLIDRLIDDWYSADAVVQKAGDLATKLGLTKVFV